ncbi:MAG TPA: DUF362 domain-containing protein, partial [Vicinamibacterales bacterium]|nr:DUF362 domain-containing protein [Vicinamibacterales bacterium]
MRIIPGDRHDLFDLATTLLEPEVTAAAPAHRPIHIVVKPNWVQHRAESTDSWDALITSPDLVHQVVRSIAALTRGHAVVSVCDAPHTYADFESILDRGALRARLARVAEEWPTLRIEILDLRRERWIRQDGIVVRRESNVEDPRGYTAVNLGRRSCLYGHSGEGRFYGADYDRGVVNRHHRGDHHEYLLAGTPLDADLFINLPKLKTHRKTGITAALKNLVGINGDKNWLPHHTEGCPANGGDERPVVGWADWVETRVKTLAQAATLSAPAIGAPLYRLARRRGMAMLDGDGTTVRNGNWWGNDTCWRMALDLNRALLFANRDGSLRTAADRKPYFCIVDGIIGGEGNGPTDPLPVLSNVLIAGGNPAEVDAVAARLMGFAIESLPIVSHAFDSHDLPISETRLDRLSCFDERVEAAIP